jgi:UDP-4-amino-4,6-dideoxy-N-acetyl-beta-L-altrosamine transaminase
MNPIPYGRQHISEEDIEEIVKVLRSDFLTQGPAIMTFERAFAEYVGAKYAVAVSSGTAALHVACLALNVNASDRYISTPISFAATTNCVLYCGGHVDFVDIDPDTYLLSLDKLNDKLSSSPPGTYTGIIPVDLTGLPVNLEMLHSIARKYDLKIIEDACHAPGASFIDTKNNKQSCGNGEFADLAIFSFHPVKHIATGEGGMVTTSDPDLYEKLLYFRTHGITKDPSLMDKNDGGWYYEMLDLGYNYRLSDIHAALGTSQLTSADIRLTRRKKIAARYMEAFQNTRIRLQHTPEGADHAYHLFVIRIEDRKGLYDFLRSKNIFAQVHYIPIHLHPYYRKLGWKKGDFPEAEKYYDECLSIPIYPTLLDEEQEYIIKNILEYTDV